MVIRRGVKKSGHEEVFFEEVLHLTRNQALTHTVLMTICIMSKAGVKNYRKNFKVQMSKIK